MRKPDFLIVGGAKSGTTSLARYLNEHPEIEIVSERLEYFGEYENPAFKIQNENEYLNLFEGIDSKIKAGEKSVSYLYSSCAPSEICRMNPDMKIIMVLRDPIDRAYSDYWHRRRSGVESLSFEEALEVENTRIQAGARFELHYASYGLYYEKVKEYIRIFGLNNVLIFTYEDLKRDPANMCKEVYRFLDVDPDYVNISFEVHNKGGSASKLTALVLRLAQNKQFRNIVRSILPLSLRSYVVARLISNYQKNEYPPMNKETKERLVSFFREDVNNLGRLINKDLDGWMQ